MRELIRRYLFLRKGFRLIDRIRIIYQGFPIRYYLYPYGFHSIRYDSYIEYGQISRPNAQFYAGNASGPSSSYDFTLSLFAPSMHQF